MLPSEIADAKSLCEKATEGPWKYGFGDGDESGLWSTTVFDTVREPTHEKEPRMIFYGTIDAASDSAFIAATRTLLPQALDALEEAHREIASRLLDAADLFRKADDRIESLETELAAANATIASVREIAEALKDCDCDCCIDDPTPAALLAAVLAEAKKPRLAAATMHVQGEGESVEAFLSRCDGESTT